MCQGPLSHLPVAGATASGPSGDRRTLRVGAAVYLGLAAALAVGMDATFVERDVGYV
jgi:hypothetical protein